jgi:septation ring formation regulator EzrA
MEMVKRPIFEILKIVAPIIFTIAVQTGSIVLWGARWMERTEGRLLKVEQNLEEGTKDRYYGKDARARAEYVDHRLNKIESNVETIAKEMRDTAIRIENKLDSYLFGRDRAN